MRFTREIYLICFLLSVGWISDICANFPGIHAPSAHIIKFQLIDGLMVIKASVNGVEGNYIYDTGSSHVILNQKCSEPTLFLSAVGGELTAKSVDFIELNLAGERIESQNVLVSDLSFVERVINVPIAGLIGGDFIKLHNVMIDFNHGEIAFFNRNQSPVFESQPTDAVVSLPYDITEGNLIVVDIEFDGVKRKMAFDTGATHSVIHSVKNEKSKSMEMADVKLKNVRVDQLPFRNMDLSNFDSISTGSIVGILGVQSLNASRIIIDREKQKIHLFWAQ